MDQSTLGSSSLIPPEVLEAVRREFGVSDGMLNVLVAEVVLGSAAVVANKWVCTCVGRRMLEVDKEFPAG
jgi:hypothetical protein